MAAQDTELLQWTVPASSRDIKEITDCILDIWEHPNVQRNLGKYSLGDMLWTDYQNMGASDLKLGFTTNSQSYPDLRVYAEQTHSGYEDMAGQADLVSSTYYEFIASRRLFGLPTYRAKYVETTLSLEDDELSPVAGVIPDVSEYRNLTHLQYSQIQKGRKPQHARLTVGQAHALHELIRRYDPDLMQLQPEGNER